MPAAHSGRAGQQPQKRRMSASDVLGPSFQESVQSSSRIRVAVPETPNLSERLGELNLAVELPPLRIVPPGHESFVSLASVQEDPNQVPINCEDEYQQEKTGNTEDLARHVSDDVTLFDPAEQAIEMASKNIDLQAFINKCLKLSVRNTRTASRDTRLRGLHSLRSGGARLEACASSNLESDSEDDDLTDWNEED